MATVRNMHRSDKQLRPPVAVAALLLVLTALAGAQEVGTIAAVDGSAELGRGGTWTAAIPGSPVHIGDELRTGRPGRLRVVFQDDSVLAVGDEARMIVNEQVFDLEKGKSRSVFDLLRGKVTALVSDYYHQAGAVYEIKTVTAVAGVRGTEFSIAYYEQEEVTEVVGISGAVTVHSLVDPTGPGVLLRANETTTVAREELPATPRRIEETIFRQQIQGFDFIGGGRAESLALRQAAGAGARVPAADRAAASVAANPPDQLLHQKRDASSLVGQSPVVVKATTGQLGIVFPR
jgi:hypothetical protein